MKWFKRIFIGLVSIYIIALGLDIFISRSLLKSNLFDGEYNVWNDIYDKNIDEELVIYGSSRSYVHINPKILDQKLNVNSYNLGFNGQKIRLVKFRNDLLTDKGIKPKNVVINLDTNFLVKYGVFKPEQFLPFILYDYKKYTFFKEDLKLNFLDFILPIIRYRKMKYAKVDLYDEIKSLYFKPNYNRFTRKKGFQAKNYPWKESDLKEYKVLIDSQKEEELSLLIEDLQKENSNVILINSPEYITQIESQINRYEIIDLYKSIAQKYNIPFIDYTADSMNYKKEYFYNEEHLNAKGADIFTKKLAQDIKPYLKK